MWVWIFLPFLVLIYSSQSKKIKRLEKRLKVIERKEKGNIDMSRLLQELIGKSPTIVGQVFGTNLWEVVDVDEEWVKLRHVDKNGKEKFKLQRIEDIQAVEFDATKKSSKRAAGSRWPQSNRPSQTGRGFQTDH